MLLHCFLSAAWRHVCVWPWGTGHQHSSCMQEAKEEPVHAVVHECIHDEGWEYTQTRTSLRLLTSGKFKALFVLHYVQEPKRSFTHTRRLLSWPLCCFLVRNFASHTKRWSRGFVEETQAQISGRSTLCAISRFVIMSILWMFHWPSYYVKEEKSTVMKEQECEWARATLKQIVILRTLAICKVLNHS